MVTIWMGVWSPHGWVCRHHMGGDCYECCHHMAECVVTIWKVTVTRVVATRKVTVTRVVAKWVGYRYRRGRHMNG